MEYCEYCGKEVSNGLFSIIIGYSEGPFYAGDCCGIREHGLVRPELAGPLLSQADYDSRGIPGKVPDRKKQPNEP